VVVTPSPIVGYHHCALSASSLPFIRKRIEEDAMPNEALISKFDKMVRGRNLILLAIADVVLFIVANVAYGPGHEHGLRMALSNAAWVLFLVGVLLLIALVLLSLAQVVRRRAKAHA
jgi:hypothetical protein